MIVGTLEDSKKGRFHGNKKKTVEETPQQTTNASSENCSSSRKKLKLDNTFEELSNKDKNYNVLPDITILISFNKKRGLAQMLSVSFTEEKCKWIDNFYNSKELKTLKRGRKAYDINFRSVIAPTNAK